MPGRPRACSAKHRPADLPLRALLELFALASKSEKPRFAGAFLDQDRKLAGRIVGACHIYVKERPFQLAGQLNSKLNEHSFERDQEKRLYPDRIDDRRCDHRDPGLALISAYQTYTIRAQVAEGSELGWPRQNTYSYRRFNPDPGTSAGQPCGSRHDRAGHRHQRQLRVPGRHVDWTSRYHVGQQGSRPDFRRYRFALRLTLPPGGTVIWRCGAAVGPGRRRRIDDGMAALRNTAASASPTDHRGPLPAKNVPPLPPARQVRF